MSIDSAPTRSLSVLLPVRNVQSSLAGSVGEILETLDDLTERFELLILDEGSTDATCEVAGELVCRFPQVQFLSDHRNDERNRSLRGVRHAKGDVIIRHDGSTPIDPRQIVHLWRSSGPGTARQTPAPSRARSAGRNLSATEIGGFQLLASEAAAINRPENAPPRPNFLARLRNHVREFTVGQ